MGIFVVLILLIPCADYITEDMVLAMMHTVLAMVHRVLDMEGTVVMALKVMRNRLKHMHSSLVIKLSRNLMVSHKYMPNLKAMLSLNHIVSRKHTSLNNHTLNHKHNHMLNRLPHTAILKVITNLKPMLINRIMRI